MTTPRSLATQILERIEKDGAYSHIALSAALDQSDLEERDRALVTELVYGTLTYQRTLDGILSQFISRRLDKVDLPILISLRMATYQLVYLDRIPEHAAVNEAVNLVKQRGGRGAAGFANGVLRAMLRKKDKWNLLRNLDPQESPITYLGLSTSLPDWIARRMIESYGFDRALSIAESFNRRPPLYFRALQEPPSPLPAGLSPVDQVPGAFSSPGTNQEIQQALAEKSLVIQDLGSQLIGHFAAPAADARILDACAGLGGKSLLLASLTGPESSLLATEPQASKLQLLQETITDTPLNDRISTFQGTLKALPADQPPFDLILVDAPCTGLGVIRRHPETRWRRHPRDIASLSSIQRKLLAQAARRIRPGGILVYSVCTFTPEEGPDQITRFLEAHPDFIRQAPPQDSPLDWSRFLNDQGDLELNPADHDTDGFYAARLIKKS